MKSIHKTIKIEKNIAMKKIIYSICLLSLAVGCAKTEVQYDQPEQISFAPVAGTVTKGAVSSGNAPGCKLIVSANAGTAGNNASTYTELYFDEVEFTGTSEYTATGVFWPNVKYLSFAGITMSAGISTDNVTLDVDSNSITVTDYTQPEVGVDDNDLMWFGQTAPAGKQSEAIEVSMQHACSWLVFNFKGDVTTGNATRPWKITNVTINGLSAQETATLSTTASWSESGTKTKSLVVYNDNTNVGTGINTTFTPSGNGIIVIPQTPPTTLSVTYNYVSQFGSDDSTETDDTVITETATIDLTYETETINGSEVSKKWEAGKKYTYDITIGATAIKIAPTAGEWEPYGKNNEKLEGTPITGTI